jgi:hypothetical protein
MKCMACKFDNQKIDEYQEDFIKIHGDFITMRPDRFEDILIYACPKCGTIRGDGYFIENIQNKEED